MFELKIKNTSGGVKTYSGKVLQDNEEYIVPSKDIYKWLGDKFLSPDIAAQDGRVEVYLNGQLLSQVEANRWFETTNYLPFKRDGVIIESIPREVVFKGFPAESVSGSVEVENASQSDNFTGNIVSWTFSHNGSSDDIWMDIIGGVETNETFRVCPFNMRLIAIEWSNDNSSVDTQIFVQVARANNSSNDVNLYTYTPSNNLRLGTKRIPDSQEIDVNIGDKIGVQIGDRGTDPNDMQVSLYWKILSSPLIDYEENFSTDFTVSDDDDDDDDDDD